MQISQTEDITPECFTLFHLVEPKLGESVIVASGDDGLTVCVCVCSADLIVLGTGARVKRIDSAVIDYLKRKGLTLEIQDTVSR